MHLEMTGDEALVLLELLARNEHNDSLAIEDQSERRALWNLQCLLEKQLAEIFQPNYQELVAAARDRLRDPVE